jgi:hypothetical protein
VREIYHLHGWLIRMVGNNWCDDSLQDLLEAEKKMEAAEHRHVSLAASYISLESTGRNCAYLCLTAA